MTHYFDISARVPLYLPERGSAGARRHALRVGHIDDDVQTHRLRETSLDLTRVFASATQLARQHSVPLPNLNLPAAEPVEVTARGLATGRPVGAIKP